MFSYIFQLLIIGLSFHRVVQIVRDISWCPPIEVARLSSSARSTRLAVSTEDVQRRVSERVG